MSKLLGFLLLTRQAVGKWKKAAAERERKAASVVCYLKEHRKDHPEDGSRQSYYGSGGKEKLGMGVTQFERLVSELGLTIERRRSWKGTSERCPRSARYGNLTNGLVLNGINQLIVGDLFYFIGELKRYVFVLTDAYSGTIVGLSGGTRMTAQVALRALDQFFELRGEGEYPLMIHHTDGGGQYFSDIYLERLNRAKIRVSVAGSCQENGYAEQKNNTVKNKYLRHMDTSSDKAFQKSLAAIRLRVNQKRPMESNEWKTPADFERMVGLLAIEDRPQKLVHDFREK